MGAVRLFVLAHDELAQARRRLPVHGAAVVARLVVAQRVEGHVGAGELAGGHALDVQLEAGRVEGNTHSARVHVQEDGLVPHTHAAQQAERIGTHSARGADVDEASVTRGNQEHLVPGLVSTQRGHDELARARADRQLDDARAHGTGPLVTHRDLADGRLAGHDALVGNADRHDVRGTPRDAHRGEQQGHDARERARQGLDPLEGHREHEAHDDERDHRPPGRGDRAHESFEGMRTNGLRPFGRDHRGGVRSLPFHRCIRRFLTRRRPVRAPTSGHAG